QGVDLVLSFVTYTLAANVENLTLNNSTAINGSGNDLANVLTGNTAANALSGDTNNDTLVGLAGNDTLNGGTGADSLVGGADSDTYVVDDQLDVVLENAGGGTADL